uniref:Uncharacterized protein n=1 Tax=Oryza meridionalis TaxID=40149 RepID=A0A0E0EVI3_9ORYZ
MCVRSDVPSLPRGSWRLARVKAGALWLGGSRSHGAPSLPPDLSPALSPPLFVVRRPGSSGSWPSASSPVSLLAPRHYDRAPRFVTPPRPRLDAPPLPVGFRLNDAPRSSLHELCLRAPSASRLHIRRAPAESVKYMHDSNQQSMPCLDPLVSIGNVASRSISTVSVHTICFSNQLVALHNICQTKNHSEFRPHDHVRLKEKESDFHACLDNKFSFKVCTGSFRLYFMHYSFVSDSLTSYQQSNNKPDHNEIPAGCIQHLLTFPLSIGLCSVEEFGTGTRGDSIYNYCTMSLIAG